MASLSLAIGDLVLLPLALGLSAWCGWSIFRDWSAGGRKDLEQAFRKRRLPYRADGSLPVWTLGVALLLFPLAYLCVKIGCEAPWDYATYKRTNHGYSMIAGGVCVGLLGGFLVNRMLAAFLVARRLRSR